jgi:hypothetical protein
MIVIIDVDVDGVDFESRLGFLDEVTLVLVCLIDC